MSGVIHRQLSRGKIFCQSEQAQACFCGPPPRSGTVCGTVRSSPALERTAFLWKYATKFLCELRSHLKTNFVFERPFPCNKYSVCG